jgi:hypothetical protein
MTTTEVSKLTGVPRATLTKYVRQGVVRPRGLSWGTGDPLDWSEADVARVRAIAAIRHWLGDGKLAALAFEQIPTVTASTRTLVMEVELPL